MKEFKATHIIDMDKYTFEVMQDGAFLYLETQWPFEIPSFSMLNNELCFNGHDAKCFFPHIKIKEVSNAKN